MSIKFGADPEVFVTDEEGSVIPPAYFREYLGMPFEPDRKHPRFLVEDGITIHEDGAAFEFTLPPSESISELLKNIHRGYGLLQDKVLKNHLEYGMKIVPTINYDVERWLTYRENEDFFYSFQFGCDPHYLAWEPEKEDEPVDAATHPYRYGGGHMHFSGLKVFKENPIMAVRAFDLTVGLAATAFSPVPELESIRTFRYGKAGVWRPQKYPDGSFGLEYRSISNSWTNPKNSVMSSAIEKWAMIAVEVLLPNLKKAEELIEKYRKPMLHAITIFDQGLAKEILVDLEGDI